MVPLEGLEEMVVEVMQIVETVLLILVVAVVDHKIITALELEMVVQV